MEILEYFLVVAIPTLAGILLLFVMKTWYPPGPDRVDRLESEVSELRSLVVRISENLLKQAEALHSLTNVQEPPQDQIEEYEFLSSDEITQVGDEKFLPVSKYWIPVDEPGYQVGSQMIRRKITTP